MREIWIPLFLITLFLFLYIIRPYNKNLRTINGLTWLPLLALLIVIILFPAYGFRPEIIPLLVYTALMTGISLSIRARDNTVYGSIRKTRLVLSIPPLVLLAAAAWVAFYFTPQKDTGFITNGVYSLKAVSEGGSLGVSNGSIGKREYFIRIYAAENESLLTPRPLLIILPPLLGSQAAVDQLSGELRDRGFTVLGFSRRGFDSPAIYQSGESGYRRYGINPAQWSRRFRAFSSGTNSASANAGGRLLEEERREDLLFLLSWISQNPVLEERTRLFNIASRDEIFLAGYDAGGSALILQESTLSGMPGLQNPATEARMGRTSALEGIHIRGLLVIESCLWSLYREEVPDIPILPSDAEWFTSVQHGFKRWYLEIKPKKITGLRQAPDLYMPVLFLVSDRGRDPFGRYQAMHNSFEAARGPAILISVNGAGPLDFSDFPAKYPILTSFFRGRERSIWDKSDLSSVTAEIISSFAESVLNAGGRAGSRLRNASLPAGIMITPNKAWPPVLRLPNP